MEMTEFVWLLPWLKWGLLVNLALDIVTVPLLMVLYAALTHVQKVSKEHKEPPTKFMVLLFAGALWLALKVDFYVNYSVGTKMFAAFPKWGDWTLSQRMSYYWDTLPETSRRRRIVGWVERNTWLNRMDWRGQHIGSKP